MPRRPRTNRRRPPDPTIFELLELITGHPWGERVDWERQSCWPDAAARRETFVAARDRLIARMIKDRVPIAAFEGDLETDPLVVAAARACRRFDDLRRQGIDLDGRDDRTKPALVAAADEVAVALAALGAR